MNAYTGDPWQWARTWGGAVLPDGERGRFGQDWWRDGVIVTLASAVGALGGALLAGEQVAPTAMVHTALLVVFSLGAGLCVLRDRDMEWGPLGILVGAAAGYAFQPLLGWALTVGMSAGAAALAWLWAGVDGSSDRGASSDGFWVGVAFAVCAPAVAAALM